MSKLKKFAKEAISSALEKASKEQLLEMSNDHIRTRYKKYLKDQGCEFTYEDFEKELESRGFVYLGWCKKEDIEKPLKELKIARRRLRNTQRPKKAYRS